MKNGIKIIVMCFVIFTAACKNTPTPKKIIDKEAITKEVTESEKQMFSLFKSGKISDAFARHRNTPDYRNIVNGNCRTFMQMDSTFKNNSLNNIKAYEYEVLERDFLIIDNANVIETIKSNRKLISKTDSIIETKQSILSLFWTKENSAWNVSYIHSSYGNEN